MQNLAEKRLPIYLLMSKCGSRGNVDNKPSVSKNFFKMWIRNVSPRNGLRKHRCLEKKQCVVETSCLGLVSHPGISAVNGAGEGAGAQI